MFVFARSAAMAGAPRLEIAWKIPSFWTAVQTKSLKTLADSHVRGLRQVKWPFYECLAPTGAHHEHAAHLTRG